MCGINGYFSLSPLSHSDKEKVFQMNTAMHYRGPDEQDFWENEKTLLAQTRLSIIGLSNGKQPICNEDASLVLVCNGEIYNYQELKQDLEAKGHIFSTESDCEVLLHLFEDKREEMLHHLRGMYAFVIYDVHNHSLFMARDINGKKPLYYSQLMGGFVFSSELTAIKNNWLSNYAVSWQEVKNHVKHSYSQELENTWIEQIKRLAPGQYAFIDKDGMQRKKYWKKINTNAYKPPYSIAKKECLSILSESVRLRLHSEVPVAILLSGGIDSSAVATLASMHNKEVHAITVGYKGQPACDERLLAQRLAQEKGLIWHEIELDENDFEDIFYEYINYLDEPNADMASIAQWAIYKKARAMGFKVLLSGIGGDELFYGYQAHNNKGEFRELKNKFYATEFANINPFLVENLHNIAFLHQETRNLPFYLNFSYAGYANLAYKWPDRFDFNKDNYWQEYFDDEKEPIDQVYSYLFNVWLCNNCYYLSDRLGMGNSLEVRAPFADIKLIDFVASLPLDFRYKKNDPKFFLKDILRGIVPDYILDAPKQGFTPPMTSIHYIIERYKSRFFNTKLTSWTQVVADAFMAKNA